MERKGPRYKVEREIGRGAFGVVQLANDNLLQRKVALKVISIPDGPVPTSSTNPSVPPELDSIVLRRLV